MLKQLRRKGFLAGNESDIHLLRRKDYKKNRKAAIDNAFTFMKIKDNWKARSGERIPQMESAKRTLRRLFKFRDCSSKTFHSNQWENIYYYWSYLL